MGTKSVKLEVKSHPLSREENGISFNVSDATTGKVGVLTVSKGGLRWVPKGMQHDFYINWSKFDTTMQEIGKKNKK